MISHCRADLFEYLPSFLNKKLVLRIRSTFICSIEKPEVISNVIGEQRLQARIHNIPASPAGRCGITLDYYCRGDVSKNKV